MALEFPETSFRAVRGHVLRLRGGIIGVPVDYNPYSDRDSGWWRVVVIGGNNPDYGVGGYDICVSDEDILKSERIDPEIFR